MHHHHHHHHPQAGQLTANNWAQIGQPGSDYIDSQRAAFPGQSYLIESRPPPSNSTTTSSSYTHPHHIHPHHLAAAAAAVAASDDRQDMVSQFIAYEPTGNPALSVVTPVVSADVASAGNATGSSGKSSKHGSKSSHHNNNGGADSKSHSQWSPKAGFSNESVPGGSVPENMQLGINGNTHKLIYVS